MKGRVFVSVFAGILRVSALPLEAYENYASLGRREDSTEKVIAEIRAAERRKIPIEVALKAPEEMDASEPVVVTIMVTNLFPEPLLMNKRMLVNHPRLRGEIAFRITAPNGTICEFTRRVTPLAIRNEDFVVLERGMSIQRSVDLSDLYALTWKGRYKIEAVYRNDIDQVEDSLRAWKGSVRAQPIDIVLK